MSLSTKFFLTFAVAALVILLPWVFPGAVAILTLNQMGIAVILAVSYNLLLGTAGLLSLGHAAYFGFGGFFAVHVIHFAADGSDSWLTAPVIPLFGGLMGLAGALVIGSFTTKRGGLIFAMMSFAMAELFLASSTVFGQFYGGSIDRTLLPLLGDINFQSDSDVFYVVWGWVGLVLALAAWFMSSPLGRMATAAGQNPDRVEYLGYSCRNLRYLTFCLSGFIAGIAGGLFALTYEFVTVEIISLQQSWLILQMVFIGGIGFFWGPPLGAILLTILSSGMSGLTDLWNLYTGIVFIAIVMLSPKGLTGLMIDIYRRLKSEPGPDLRRSYAICLSGVLLLFCGGVGLAEMAYFLNSPISSGSSLPLLGIDVSPGNTPPWIVFGLLFSTGLWLTVRAGKRLA